MIQFLLILAGVLAVIGTVFFFIAKSRKAKVERMEKDIDEMARRARLAEADNESLLKYMADSKALKEIHDDDYIAFKESADKHATVGAILDRVYGLSDG